MFVCRPFIRPLVPVRLLCPSVRQAAFRLDCHPDKILVRSDLKVSDLSFYQGNFIKHVNVLKPIGQKLRFVPVHIIIIPLYDKVT